MIRFALLECASSCMFTLTLYVKRTQRVCCERTLLVRAGYASHVFGPSLQGRM